MDKRSFLEFLWGVGECEAVEIRLVPEGEYRIVERGVKIEGARADLSNCIIESLSTGEVFRGDAKIDTKSSDWRESGSLDDPAYNNIILHIVSEYDTILLRNRAQQFLTCIITPSDELREACHRLPLSCHYTWHTMNSITRNEILSRLLDDRIQRKINDVAELIKNYNASWQEQCYLLFFRGMGTPSRNKDEFERVARHISYNFILNHINRQTYIEGVLLGRIGYLDMDDQRADPYTLRLREEFKKNEDPLHSTKVTTSWNTKPHRPSSAPALSLIQAITILVQRPDLFEDILRVKNLEQMRKLFMVELPEYWQTHSAPSAGLGTHSAVFSKKRIDLLILNFVIPLLLYKAKEMGDLELWQRVFDYYEQIESENFKMLSKWNSSEWQLKSAYDSQALVQLNGEYCREGRCTDCMIGRHALYKLCNKGDF